MLDTNQAPYFNDFDALKNYFEILFVPERAVQARELSQIQSILQNQLRQNASHFFKDGSNITNASVSVSFNQDVVDLNATDVNSNAVNIDESWVGRVFVGQTSGATFRVTSVDSTLRKLYIQPLAGTLINENIDIDPIQDSASPTTLLGTINNIGKAIKATNDPGIVFANGFFIQTSQQEIIVQQDGVSGSHVIGFEFEDSFVTEGEDGSLVDPANGSPNQNAPGAHRLRAELVLSSYEASGEIPDEFYAFVTIEDGVIVSTHNAVQYADIIDLLATRTFDESGDYTVSNFPLILEDNVNDESKLDLVLEPGNAYVQGYNFRTISPQTITIDKPRTTNLSNAANIYSSFGTFFIVDSMSGGLLDVSRKQQVRLFSDIDGNGTEIAPTNTIRVMSLYEINSSLRIYLSGIADSQAIFSSVRSITSIDGAKIVNIDTRALEQDRLTGTVEESLYGISPNPAAILFLNNDNVSDVVLNDTNFRTQRSYIGYTNKVGNDFVIDSGDQFTDFAATGGSSAVVAVFDSISGADLTSTALASVSGPDFQTLTLSNISPAITSIDVITSQITKTNTAANPKTKIITEVPAQFVTDANGNTTLTNVDIFEIVSLIRDPSGAAEVINVNSINLNNGQNDFFYDFGSISGLAANETYDIVYRYFAHSGTGDYFSVNSYINATNQGFYADIYSRIYNYRSQDGLLDYQISDCLDFRRSVNDLASGTDIVAPESALFLDYNYYLPRVDKIYITTEGNFGVTNGIPNDFTDEPNDLPNSLTLYTLNLPGYTRNSEEVLVNLEDTQRYTMRDIGRLEKRIEDLEYYTALSLVENETNSLLILDADGNNKFKNGILVDSFQDHSIGDTLSPDYLVAIDEQEQEARPTFTVDSIDLITQQEAYLIGGNDWPNQINNISVNENTLTLAFTPTVMIDQPRASETINVNPFNVFVWYGDIKLVPPSDNWIDTEFKPSVTVSIDGNVDAFRRAANFMGTKWNSWNTNWSGTTTKTSTERRVISTSVDRSNWRQGPHGTWLSNVSLVERTRQTVTTRKDRQSRTGSRLNVGSKWVKRDLGTRVVDTRVVPFIRTRSVTFNATGFKPNTQLVALFDGVDVTNSCTSTNPTNPTGTLITDAAGALIGNFVIPAGQFKTGTRDFVLIDDVNNPGTESKATYTASGLLQTKERQILSVETPVVSTSTFSETRTLTSSSSRSSTQITQERSRPYDPIAESFFVDEEGGVFIDSVEVYFQTKDSNIPVSLEIVANDNGYPSTFTLPFAKTTLLPADINVSTDGSVSTEFKFSDPIYLEHLAEYSFVMKSNSNNYNVFVAKTGGIDLLTNKVISEQPYIGSLFKSQNAFTWNADQERDIKFKINRCQFDINPTNIFFQQVANPVDQNFTAFMPNIDTLEVDGTSTDVFFSVAASGASSLSTAGYSQITNKENIELSNQTTFNSDTSPLRMIVGMITDRENISPVVHRYRNSAIVINNFTQVDSGSDLYAGSYISQTPTLADAADDLRLLVDVEKENGSDIEVYYRIGEVVPKFVEYDNAKAPIREFEGKRLYVYHIASDLSVSLQGSVISTNINSTDSRFFVKQISNISSFINQADFVANGLIAGNGVIVTDDTEFDGQTYEVWDENATYDRVEDNNRTSFVFFDNKFWKSNLSNNTAGGNTSLSPGTGFAWSEVQFHTLTSILQDNVKQTWQPMVLEQEIDSSVDTTRYNEYSYVPEDDIREEFTQYAVRIDYRTNDAARISKCKELRVLALS